jgi:WD40 repeat protein
MAWGPDGRRLALTNLDWTVRLRDAASGEETVSLGRSRGVVRPEAPNPHAVPGRTVLAWSGDGRRLATSAALERTIQVWDPATGDKLLTLAGHAQEIRALAWSRDGKRLASAGDDGALKVWDVAAGKEILSRRFAPPRGVLSDSSRPRGEALLAWSADGVRLAAAGGDGAVTVWDVVSGKEVVALYGPRVPVSSVAWSPDDRRLASTGGDGTLNLWDVASGQEVFTLHYSTVFPGKPTWLAWSPDGRRLALALDGPPEAVVMVWDASTEAEKPGPGK